MKSFFALITRLSLRFRAITLVIILVVGVLGVAAASQLQLELIPSIEFPQTVVIAQVSGMSSDEVLTLITTPLEKSVRAIDGVVNEGQYFITAHA